ncbi:DUF723 domain-containing protein [Candidatus Dojkabacteria bacterium]|jgi:hypothetical protein|nr:DUF723 domain-containing protein [Candidatus Dojkabacteria bacterium]
MGYNYDSQCEKFIKKAKIIHNNFYTYSKVIYQGSRVKVKIICPIHSEFEQTPEKHLLGQGCPKCARNNKKTTEDFISIAKVIHNNFYDYQKTIYDGANKNVVIICPEHGEFQQKAHNHLIGYGCKKCKYNSKKYTFEEYVNKANIKHNNFYDYIKEKNNDKITIVCPLHGVFEQDKSAHLFGQGCPECANDNKRLTIENFKERSNFIHNFEYDYSKVNYKNNYTQVEIICKKHGSFYQTPNFHLLGQGCPKCKSSKGEKEIINFLELNKIKYIHQKTFDDCKNKNKLPFDFYIPHLNICIEYNGKQHYESIEYFGGIETLKYIKNNDLIKETFCHENCIKLYIIKFDDNVLEKLREIEWNII